MADLLLVDDDAELAAALAEFLVGSGFTVRVAHNGKDGLIQLKTRLPDVLLLDVEMPVLSGPAMAYEMVVHDAGMEAIPVVLSSGAADLGRIAAQLGTPYFLAKPYPPGLLLRLLERALAERTPPRRRS